MELQTATIPPRQRVRPTRSHLEALVGTWDLGGTTVRMMEEPGTGVLLALDPRGELINPLKVISKGSKR